MNDDERAKFENDLIHQRLTWLGTFEGLLFIANNYTTNSNAHPHPYLLPIAGLIIAFSIDMGCQAANKVLNDLGAQTKGWRKLFMPGTLIPKVIEGAWLVILFEQFRCG